MLIIKNRHKLISEKVLRHTTDGYSIEGVYEYPDHYQIHIRSENKTIPDELLLLLRNKVKHKPNNPPNYYYTLYNSNVPQRRLNLTKEMIKFKDMFLYSIETILQMNN
jgi:hypothetical protein